MRKSEIAPTIEAATDLRMDHTLRVTRPGTQWWEPWIRMAEFGTALAANNPTNLRQIGHLLRISKERVRQIQNRALEKLRASAERVGWEPNLLLE